MAGVEALGQRVMAGAQGLRDPSLADPLDHLGVQVTSENVLQIRAALVGEAERLDDLLRWHRPTLRISAPAPDPVSVATERSLNPKIQALTDQYQAYVDTLKAAGAVLAQIAQEYGYTEQQITDSFRSLRQDSGSDELPR